MLRAPMRLLRVSRAVTFGPLQRTSLSHLAAPAAQVSSSLRVSDQAVSSRTQVQSNSLVLRRTALPSVANGASSPHPGASGLAMASAVASAITPAACPLGSLGDLRKFAFVCSFVPLEQAEIQTLEAAAEAAKTTPHSHPAPPGLFSSYTPRPPSASAAAAAAAARNVLAMPHLAGAGPIAVPHTDSGSSASSPIPPKHAPALLVDAPSLSAAAASRSLAPAPGESGWSCSNTFFSRAGPRSLKAGLTQFLMRTHPDFVASVEVAATEARVAAAAAEASDGGRLEEDADGVTKQALPSPDAIAGTNAQSLSRLLSFLEAAKDARTRAETVALEFFVRVHCYENPFQKHSALTDPLDGPAAPHPGDSARKNAGTGAGAQADAENPRLLALPASFSSVKHSTTEAEAEAGAEGGEDECVRSGVDARSRAAHRREHRAMIQAALRRLALPFPSHSNGNSDHSASSAASMAGKEGDYGRKIEYRWAESPPPPPSPVFPFILVRAELRGRPLRRPSLVAAAAERRGRGDIDPHDRAARAEIRRVIATLLADAGVHVPVAASEGVDPLAGLGFGGMASA